MHLNQLDSKVGKMHSVHPKKKTLESTDVTAAVKKKSLQANLK